MSESEVSQIRDEDVLRRMWQQTEDFSRKKEIRAHMYRLREERLRNLYSPEPSPGGKGCEFTSEQGHVKSFADQNFQSMKSKEVRDAGSPPKEFTYRGQDLKELSNAGWNVESEDRRTDDGRTHVKSVNANIEGRYDVAGGRGQFAAVDRQRQATTEYHDDHSSLRRDENSSATAAHEHVVRQTDDGTRVSSTTSSSNTSSNFQQVSSTKHETVPYLTDDDYDRARQTAHDTNRNEQVTRVTNRNDHEQTLRKIDYNDAELVSRKVEYPDDNTKVIVETRCLPDGTRVTSTRREFRVPAQSTRSEYQTKSESKSYSSQHKLDTRDSTSKMTRHTVDNRSEDIVDSQRNVDNIDFKRQIRQYAAKDDDDYSNTQQHYVTKTDRKVTDSTQTDDAFSQKLDEIRVNKKIIDHSTTKRNDLIQTHHHTTDRRTDNEVDETDRRQVTSTRDHDVQHKVVKETHKVNNDTEERQHIITRDHQDKEEKIYQVTRDMTVNEERFRDVPKDRSVPAEKYHETLNERSVHEDVRSKPRVSSVPVEGFHDIPKDSTIPADQRSDLPRGKTIPMEKVHDISRDRTVTDERIHHSMNDTKIEEVIERKTSSDNYETTYQNDYQSRKVSSDWSPTHQAWASTLRSDTPTNTRPSTRASSPGSRTLKSSTSSLRSSVSPDKSSRKPSSRGGSPNKIDRYSPTRTVTSDRYSSTHSSNSVTESRTSKTTSPERKPPTGRSPTRHGYSPDRKRSDIRYRPSTSPEKRPQGFMDRPSSSPERKAASKSFPTDRHTRTTSPSSKKESPRSPVRLSQSPERKPIQQSPDKKSSDTYPTNSLKRTNLGRDSETTTGHPNRLSPRSSPSPDRKPGYEKAANSSTRISSPSQPSNPAEDSPRSETSPKLRPACQQPPTPSRQSPDKPSNKFHPDTTAKRPSMSPERKPGYMRPIAAKQSEDKTNRPSSQGDDSDRKSPTKDTLSYSPDRKHQDIKKTTKLTQDHYKFVDEETKVYSQANKTDYNQVPDDIRPREESPLLTTKVPSKSASPQKDIIINTGNDDIYGKTDDTVETINIATKSDKKTKDVTTAKRTLKHDELPVDKSVPSRETSPSKYGTYDRKKPREGVKTTEVTSITTENNTNKEIKYESMTRRDKTSPKKVPVSPTSPKKTSPSDSNSPDKPPSKDSKYKHTTDFIATEITTEETNKNASTKDRPRQLITPSSSPTRKPKVTETEPSTGQSSPTTSVSGFVYFGSPHTEKPIVTDLDEFYPESEQTAKRPESLDVSRSSSPSKIPCRSPSQEKHMPATKENLPRKSSLKKPAPDMNKTSPVEKPPTSFRVSPADDKHDEFEHKVIKKDRPSEPETGEQEIVEHFNAKPKPPLRRRETYEDRCKKILGMVDDTTTETVTTETRKFTNKPDSGLSSPSVSPCESPILLTSPSSDYPHVRKVTSTNVDVTDFITHEQEDITKTTDTTSRETIKSKIPSRDSSPTKLQDIIIKTNSSKTTPEDRGNDTISLISKHPSESPERKSSTFPTKPSQRTEGSPSRSNTSPERRPVQKYPKEASPSRKSPEQFSRSYTTKYESSEFDTISTINNVQETTKISEQMTKKNKSTRVLESPTRETPESEQSFSKQSPQPRLTSSSRPQSKESSPVRKTASPISRLENFEHLSNNQLKTDTVLHPDNITRSRLRQSPEKIPGYMKSTTTVTSKYEDTITTENTEDIRSVKNPGKREPQNKSPTRGTPNTPTASPAKPSRPATSPQRKSINDVLVETKNDLETNTSHTTRLQEVPRYMKTTTAASVKVDKTFISEKNKDSATTKTVQKKQTSLNLPDLPNRNDPSLTPSREHRTPSPNKSKYSSDISPERKTSKNQHPLSPNKETSPKKSDTKHPAAQSPTHPGTARIPGYMKSTASVTSKYESTEYGKITTEDIQTSEIPEVKPKVFRNTESPTREIPESTRESSPEYVRRTSPSRSLYPTNETSKIPNLSLDRKPSAKNTPAEEPKHKNINILSANFIENKSGCTKTKTNETTTINSTTIITENQENTTHKTEHQKDISEIPSQKRQLSDGPHSLAPSKPSQNSSRNLVLSPDNKTTSKAPMKDTSLSEKKHSKDSTSERPSVSPVTPSYMKPTASRNSKLDSSNIFKDTQEIDTSKLVESNIPSRTAASPDRHSPNRGPRENRTYVSKSEEPRELRTPSPIKKTTKIIESSTEFIHSEREQEILNKVQNSLRKLSPERKEKSPSRERSPSKSTTSLQDLDIITTGTIQTDQIVENFIETVEEQKTSKGVNRGQPKEHNMSIKPSRNVSPIKKTPATPSNKVEKSPESPTKSRSISPKKPVLHVERPHSPQVPKTSGIRPRDQIPPHLTRKPTPATLATVKIEKHTTDVKKTNGITKQNLFTKTITSKTVNRSIPSPTSKNSESEPKRAPTPKSVKENVSPKKDLVTRTTSEIGIKPKKTSSPQRMKSKPEIQVSDMSTKSPKYQKPVIREPHSKLPSKPKSATALNTSTDEDDIIIDVQQSKSSRENSPDRICPTPVNFCDDVGIPRFPDEVSEPDDDFIKRTYHTIHETESVVDDIVEICEDEELFVKKSENIPEHDDSLLSVNDKVNKFTSKINSVTKPKDITTSFKNTERRVHSDFEDKTLKSDECLLTVSEKVHKFAKGPRDTKDSRSPSRKIVDEYDNNTVYQDDYTKLSVNDKAHLFVETAENVKVTKAKPAQKVQRPDLSQVDESLKSDDCLLSVSDKVNKFVKTAEQYLTDSQVIEETEAKINEQHEKNMSQIVGDDQDTIDTNKTIYTEELVEEDSISNLKEKSKPQIKDPKTSQPKVKPKTKPSERVPAIKITTLRSSEAVKKAKALFENIASTQKETQKDTSYNTKTTKLTDIGVIKKSTKSDSTTVLHSSIEDVSLQAIDTESDINVASSPTDRLSSATLIKPQHPRVDEKPRSSPSRLLAHSPEVPRPKSPMRQSVEVTTTKTSRYPAVTRAESPRQRAESPRQRTESPRQRTESPRQRSLTDNPDKIPGYLRPTKTSQIKEETKVVVEDSEVSSRRGSGKFGVELRRTSVERSTVSSERRRSVDHHQPCIEDIFDLDLLEQMLEKVAGYEQRRRIRAQIRVARNQCEQIVDTNTYTRTNKQNTSTYKNQSPDRKVVSSPNTVSKMATQKTLSPDHHTKLTPHKVIPERTQTKEPAINGHAKEPETTYTGTRERPHSPEKQTPKSTLAPRTPVRQPSPDIRRTVSPNKATPKPKGNRFSEYASAYMKKVGLKESDKIKFTDTKTKKTTDAKQTVKHERQEETVQEFTSTKSFTERTSSKDVIEIVQTNGKRSPSPEQRYSPERKVQFPERTTQTSERKAQSPGRKAQSPVRKAQSPERKAESPVRKTQSPDRKAYSPERRTYSPEQKTQSPERLQQRTPSPDFKRPKSDTVKETIIKTVYDIEKKLPAKPIQEEKPSWVTNRNLKKITSETRTYSSKKIENEKQKYRATSPSKVIAKPIDVITSSYGPGPLDADGKPLFGIKALRNGATNFQVKGTVIRQEFHSRNGGEPEGTVSVTAYSSQPEELEKLLASQGGEPPSRIHGLAAITTTKKFGGDTGNTLSNVHTKEDRASLEQFTHHDRRVDTLDNRIYETSSHDFSDDTRSDEILDITSREDSGSTRRIESKKDDIRDKNNRSTRRDEKITEVRRGQKVEERREKIEKREDKKTVRQSSVKSLTEKYIKSANDSGKTDRSTYPKAGLILRTTTMRDSVSSDDAHPGLVRTDSEHSLGSVEDAVVTRSTQHSGGGGGGGGGERGMRTTTTTTRTTHRRAPVATTHTTLLTRHEPVITTKKTSTVITQEPVITHRVISHEPVIQTVTRGQAQTTTTERSFLDSSTKVTGVQDILSRMKNADIVIQEGDTTEDSEARALLNKFLGASVLMAGMQSYVTEQPSGKLLVNQESVRTSSTGGKVTSRTVEEIDLDQCWDERLLKDLLEECTDYEQRRRLRARIRTLMAEQEACASAVTEALGAAGAAGGDAADAREEEEVTVTSSVRRDSSDKTVSSSTTTKTSKVIEMTRSAPKPVSPFAKFRQLEKQNSTNSPNSPKTPQSPGSPSQPYFKFTDPALQCSALTIKERLLQWCRDKTRDYENVKLENFSTSWADGLAFCALVHHFLPDAFDYSKLTADKRRHNFTLAFKVADEKAGIYPLLDVDDMVAMRKPDWKCVFTYVQAIYRRFKDEQ